ncbi:3-oxoacyl-acyl carrier protein reductase-like protein [Thermochaetoides thermophila DSM 1495]|uniref:3-oxoacyl-acyl carrier protein reductase-like protein n=1 Tax=Chaetomium thermophilum (strain DSM 1495 / CBS 144.50 / IMI 039719) TaxID=759272 RepID=G0RZ55_CHATD|nr:3-oxoacyl-acyl carrier protein reductase-like protein [Thermochaetoides thermophila DSM 1495]EGS23483.1 3-oxoacyl-acyl carrier protein reductase-like protein [Thermochaetoides thermophila DSM 1495]
MSGVFHTLKTRLAVITGATGTLGTPIARRFAQEGASVIVASRNCERAQKTLESLKLEESWPGQEHRCFEMDVKETGDWERLVKEHKSIDILVNCAGLDQHKLLVKMTEKEVDELLQTNLTSTIWGCRFVGRQMMQRQVKAQRQSHKTAERASQREEEQPFGGAIINVSSVLAQRGMVGTSIYSAAKAGILGLTTSLALELGQYNIRVNAVLPGPITGSVMTESQHDGISRAGGGSVAPQTDSIAAASLL